MGVARWTALHFCFPSRPHCPTLYSAHFCLCNHSTHRRAPPPSPSITVRVVDRVRHRPLVTLHPVAAQVAGQRRREPSFTALPSSSTWVTIDHRAPSSFGPYESTASSAAVPYYSLNQCSTPSTNRPRRRRPPRHCSSSSLSLGRHSEPFSTKLVPIEELGLGLGPWLLMHRSPTAGWPDFTGRVPTGKGGRITYFYCGLGPKGSSRPDHFSPTGPSARWNEARSNSVISLLSIRIIQIKFKLLKFIGTWLYSIKL
jgi:hypothetical protein